MSERVDDPANKVARYVVAGLGILLMLGVLPFYLSSGLVAPLWAIIVLLVIWVALFALALHWLSRHPYWVIALPFVAALIWFVALSAGEAFLGWTA